MRLPLCVRIDFDDEQSALCLDADGWRAIETLQIWAGIAERQRDNRVQMGSPFYWESLHTRLHKDPKISDEAANTGRWMMMQQAASQGDCLVIGKDAFVIFHREGSVRVDFIAVRPEARGKGLGKALIHHIGGKIIAGTQSTNEAANAFYRSLGFHVTKMQRTYHK